jgi:MoaA/NifB/PqqE/SkfB family radical SAM enzyme
MSRKIRGIDEKQRDTLISNIEYIAKERKFPIKVETILLKETVDHYADINQFLYNIGVKHHKMEFLLPLGHAQWEAIPGKDEIKNAIIKTYREKAADAILELSCCYFSPCYQDFEEIFSIKDDNFIIHKCLDGRKVFYIMANGIFSPCYAFYRDDLPNIKDRSLTDIINGSELVKKIENERNTRCNECKHYRSDKNISCNNGCWALMLSEVGNLNKLCYEYVTEKLKA